MQEGGRNFDHEFRAEGSGSYRTARDKAAEMLALGELRGQAVHGLARPGGVLRHTTVLAGYVPSRRVGDDGELLPPSELTLMCWRSRVSGGNVIRVVHNGAVLAHYFSDEEAFGASESLSTDAVDDGVLDLVWQIEPDLELSHQKLADMGVAAGDFRQLGSLILGDVPPK